MPIGTAIADMKIDAGNAFEQGARERQIFENEQQTEVEQHVKADQQLRKAPFLPILLIRGPISQLTTIDAIITSTNFGSPQA